MSSRVRMIPAPPRRFPPMPGWARPNDLQNNATDALFAAGAALAALRPIARDEHLLGALWRQRLALKCAAVLAGQGGRTEDEAMLRDHWYLRQSSDDPGPPADCSAPGAASGAATLTLKNTWPTMLPVLLACRYDEALQEAIACALAHCIGGGNPVQAAAATAAMSLRLRPDCRPLALWLADAVLAHRLSWPAPVPLLAAYLTGHLMRRAATNGDDPGWMQACSLAYRTMPIRSSPVSLTSPLAV